MPAGENPVFIVAVPLHASGQSRRTKDEREKRGRNLITLGVVRRRFGVAASLQAGADNLKYSGMTGRDISSGEHIVPWSPGGSGTAVVPAAAPSALPPVHSPPKRFLTHKNICLFFRQLNFNRVALSLRAPLDWFWSYIRSEHLE